MRERDLILEDEDRTTQKVEKGADFSYTQNMRKLSRKPSLFNAHTMIFIVHIFMNVNKLCLNQDIYMEHKNFHTETQHVHSASRTEHTSLSYTCMSKNRSLSYTCVNHLTMVESG